MLVGCSMTVPRDEVYGTYVASYPFGTDAMTLKRDGTFVQHIAVEQEQPLTISGKWEFDDNQSRANFYGALTITDGFDHLKDDWRTAPPGIVSLDVERHWFKMEMGSAATYPYIKQ